MPRKPLQVDDVRAIFRRLGQEDKLDAAIGAPRASNSPVSTPKGLDEPPKPKKGKKRGQMNNVEREYAMILERQKREGEILDYFYEGMTLRFGESEVVRYTADFAVFKPGGVLKLIECKGPFIRPIDVLRWKSAANAFPMLTFEMWQKQESGEWHQVR